MPMDISNRILAATIQGWLKIFCKEQDVTPAGPSPFHVPMLNGQADETLTSVMVMGWHAPPHQGSAKQFRGCKILWS